jgi:hypothetical protein
MLTISSAIDSKAVLTLVDVPVIASDPYSDNIKSIFLS